MSFLNILYKVYSFCIALPIFVLITIFVSTSVIIAGFLGDTDIVSYYLPKFWSKCAFWLFLLRVKIEGRENIKKEESYVFLANHQGYYDIFLVYGYLGHNFKWMMKEYLRKIPFVGYACTKCKQIKAACPWSSSPKAHAHAPARWLPSSVVPSCWPMKSGFLSCPSPSMALSMYSAATINQSTGVPSR